MQEVEIEYKGQTLFVTGQLEFDEFTIYDVNRLNDAGVYEAANDWTSTDWLYINEKVFSQARQNARETAQRKAWERKTQLMEMASRRWL